MNEETRLKKIEKQLNELKQALKKMQEEKEKEGLELHDFLENHHQSRFAQPH